MLSTNLKRHPASAFAGNGAAPAGKGARIAAFALPLLPFGAAAALLGAGLGAWRGAG